MDIGSALALLILTAAFFRGVDTLFIASVGLIAFGSLAALPPGATAGVTVTASNLGFLLLLARSAFSFRKDTILEALLSFNKLALLSVFIIQAAICTAILPWLFAGEIYVYPLRSEAGGSVPVPVAPSATNVTQLSYMLLSYFMALFTLLRSQRGDFQGLFRSSVLILAILIIATGMLDLFGANAFLDIFRNASYALVGDTSIGSTKRVVGAMPEASAFGYNAASIFSILLIMRRKFGMTLVWAFCVTGTGIFSVLSASSTAYGMLGGTFLAFVVQLTIRLFLDGRFEQERSAIELIFLVVFSALALEVALYIDSVRNEIFYLFDSLILNKSNSSSYEERMRWTRAAYDAFISSHGLGIGVGTARTSNGLINLFASTGVLGTILYISFIIKLIIVRPYQDNIYESYSALLVLVSPIIGLILSSSSADFGVIVAILFGLQSSSSRRQKVKIYS